MCECRVKAVCLIFTINYDRNKRVDFKLKASNVQTAEQCHECVNGWNQAERELEQDLG